MKNNKYLLFLVEKNVSVTVIKDCTGSYLRLDNKDYHICNEEMVTDISEGTTVTATFKKIKECNGSARDRVVCHMYHENEGWIEIKEIK